MDNSGIVAHQQQTQMAVNTDINMYSSTNMHQGERASPIQSTVNSSIQSVINSTPSATSSPTLHVKNTSSQNQAHEIPTQILTRTKLQELVKEVDPSEQLDEDVEEILLQLAEDFVESTVNAACLLAKHRNSNTVEVKDIQLYLERNWNMWLPGFGTDELRSYKRSSVTEAHKQRMALIRKTLKKY